MIERSVHGPMEFLPPDSDFNGVLEVGGITLPNHASPTIHVFLEEVREEDLEAMKQNANYAGSFCLPDDASYLENGRATVLLDITHALQQAERKKPNFHITFVAQADGTPETAPLFRYDSVHIRHRVPENRDLNISAKVTGGLAIDHDEPI